MRVLLTTLNSKYVHSNLALKYLYHVAAMTDLDVDLTEFTINNDKSYIYTEILRGGYDLVCFSCYIWNIEQIKELGANLKKASPKMKILLGGPEVSHDTRQLMEEHPWIDFVIRGEGEYPFSQFCKELISQRYAFSYVEGLSYRKGGEILENEDAPALDMEFIPFPYEKLPIAPDKVVYYEASRGCPYRCSYCLSSLDKVMRPLPIERVKRDLQFFLDENVKQVKFIDRTFNYDKKRTYELWKYLIDHDNGVTNFHFEICGEILDDMLFDLLKKARKELFQFEIGIQSTNGRALEAVDRRDNINEIWYNVKRLVAMDNIHIHVDLIAGLPYEDYESFGKSFNRVYALRADNLQLGFLKLLKGTRIRKEAEAHGFMYRDKAPYEVISNNYLSAVELIQLKMVEEVLDLFSNRGGFERTLSFLEKNVAAGPFDLFEQIADFYYAGGYQHRSHKKDALYRILMRFVETRKGLSNKMVEEARGLLLEDLAATMNEDTVKKFHKKGWEI